ncbi:MAG: site-specific integrase [Candidatus Sumerlaeota bacterium]|nr:site-specific integrase [Candidatus Sumerlaeota bacterium]
MEIKARYSQKARITKRLLDAVKPAEKDFVIWDEDLTGFHVKVTPKGRKTFLVFYRAANGTPRRPSIGTYPPMPPDEARREASAILLAAQHGTDYSEAKRIERAAPTLSEFAERYLADYARPHKKARSVKDDEGYLKRYIKPALGKKRVTDITRADVLNLQKKLEGVGVTANRVLACLSKMMNLAELWDLRPDGSNPCRHVKRFREKARRRYLSPEEMIKLAKAINDQEEKKLIPQASIDFFRIALFTGMRSGEIRGLRWEDYDPINRVFHLRDSKTGPKDVILNEPAIEVLDRIERHPSGWVCPGRRRGQPLTNPAKPWEKICNAAGLKDFNIHDMRHVFGGVAAGLDMGLPVIGALMGHTVPQTTARYANMQNDPLHVAAEAIGQALKAMTEAKPSAEVIDATPAARDSEAEGKAE